MTDVTQVNLERRASIPGPWISLLVAPVLTLMSGAIATVIYTAHMDAAIGTHSTQITAVEGRMDRVETRVGGHDAVLAQVSARLDALTTTIVDNDRRATDRAQNLLEGLRRVQDTIMSQLLAQQQAGGGQQQGYPAPPRHR